MINICELYTMCGTGLYIAYAHTAKRVRAGLQSHILRR